jgi:hypothetical protein
MTPPHEVIQYVFPRRPGERWDATISLAVGTKVRVVSDAEGEDNDSSRDVPVNVLEGRYRGEVLVVNRLVLRPATP